jgi:hypothetical protein
MVIGQVNARALKPSKGTAMKTFITLLAISAASLSFNPSSANASPLSDCYDDAIAACGYIWPGQDSGDKEYKSCVDSGMSLCEGAHKPKPLGLTLAPKRRALSLRAH